MSELLLDRAGRRRSPATMPGFHDGRPPPSKRLRYPADPPKVEEIIAVMRAAGDGQHGRRLRGLIVILWRAGLHPRGARPGRGGSRSAPRRVARPARQGRTARMDARGWEQLRSWLAVRLQLPVGPLLCIVNGPTHGRRLIERGRARGHAKERRGGGRAPVVQRASAPPRPCRRAAARRRAADGHPAPARQQQPRHHQRRPASHRQRRDHRRRPRPPRPMIPVSGSLRL